MIGVIRFRLGGGSVSAALADGGQWSCADQQALAFLREAFTPDGSPAHGVFGHYHLHHAAEFFGGHVISEAPLPENNDPPDTIY